MRSLTDSQHQLVFIIQLLGSDRGGLNCSTRPLLYLLLHPILLHMNMADEILIEPPYNLNDYIFMVDHEDSGACSCGQWMFYSSTCGGLYQVFPVKCGISLTRRGHNTRGRLNGS